MDNKSNQDRTVSILGCGWVGLPLAENLAQTGCRVKGSTTSAEKMQLLAAKNLEPFLIDIHRLEDDSHTFFKCQTLLVSVPPSLRKGVDGADYINAMGNAAAIAKKNGAGRVIMISSTGVYPDTNGEVTENTEASDSERSQTLYRAEQVWRKAFPENHIILRSAGLMGGNRIPGRYFAGKTGLTTAHVPVNYIHREDIVNILTALATTWNLSSGTYNAVAPLHPKRKEVYLANAEKIGFDKPGFRDDSDEAYKVVNGDKLQQALGYSFVYPDPLSFSYDPA
ncbi:MAG: SDR family oxidoreductase [Cyclobacteriaceae bacterium]